MARSREGALLTERHRAVQLSVRAATLRDLLAFWGTVDPTNLRGTIDPFTRAAGLVVNSRARQSAAVSTAYAQAFRQAEGVPGALAIGLPTVIAPERAADTTRGAALSGIINARRRGFSEEAAAQNGFVKVSGAATRLVLNAGRDVVLASVRGDREARGFQRITGPNECAFCDLLASRGPVYKSEETADFPAHDHCTCSAEPVYE